MRRLSMVRLSALALATLAVACTGEIVDPSGNAAKAAAAGKSAEPTDLEVRGSATPARRSPSSCAPIPRCATAC
jgi:hypothetical protein